MSKSQQMSYAFIQTGFGHLNYQEAHCLHRRRTSSHLYLSHNQRGFVGSGGCLREKWEDADGRWKGLRFRASLKPAMTLIYSLLLGVSTLSV